MKRLNQKGSSMVSVIIAFLLLMMGVAMFTTVIYAAADLVSETEKVRKMVDQAMGDYYMGDITSETEIMDDIQLKDSNGLGFKISGSVYEADVDGYTIYYFK